MALLLDLLLFFLDDDLLHHFGLGSLSLSGLELDLLVDGSDLLFGLLVGSLGLSCLLHGELLSLDMSCGGVLGLLLELGLSLLELLSTFLGVLLLLLGLLSECILLMDSSDMTGVGSSILSLMCL